MEETTVQLDSTTDSALQQDEGADSAALLKRGDIVGRYEIIRQLGQGGMGVVHLARDLQLGRLVAIKYLREQNAKLAHRFITEARATAAFNHENIVTLYEAGEHRGHPYMVLEYLKGKSLHEWLHERTAHSGSDTAVEPLAPTRAIELMVPVVRALVCAHAAGVIHRDLKPQNIILTQSGTVKVLDFGIAMFRSPLVHAVTTRTSDRSIEVRQSATQPGQLAGTLPYMSPEQLLGKGVDQRSDIWAVGVMLYMMVTGKHPLSPVTIERLLSVSDIDMPMPSVRENRHDLGTLGGIIDRSLLKNKSDRTATAEQLLAELEPLLPTHGAPLLSSDEAPFAGLAAFQESDTDRFFGRSREISTVVTQLRNTPLVAVVGPSGAGKSSLVRAGVLPALKRSGEGWEAFVVRPGRRPLTALANLLARLPEESNDFHDGGPTRRIRLSYGEHTERLRVEPGYMGAALRERAKRKIRRVVIFVDQFEELYTLGASAEERDAFVNCLDSVADDASSPLRLLISVRSDFIDRLAEHRLFMHEVSRGLMIMPPLSRGGLREALVKPVEAAEYRFESPAMVEDILDALEATNSALPLLQFAASKLWEYRDREFRILSEASYIQMGGVAGALAVHADTVLGSMHAQRRALAREILERLVTPERTRAVVSMSELRELPGGLDEVEGVIQFLADARLLVITSDRESDDKSVELVHESLIGGWPTLQRWLDENQGDAVFRARLRNAANQWEANGRAAGTLWRDEAADEARRWFARHRDELAARERSYLEAVFALADRSARNKRRLVYGFFAMLALFVYLIGRQESSYVAADRAALRVHFTEYVTYLDTFFSKVTDHMQMLRATAEEHLGQTRKQSKKRLLRSKAFDMIKPRQDGDGFAMDEIRPSLVQEKSGNLTGLGSFRKRSRLFYREVEMALHLNHGFHQANKSVKDLVWLYYTSGKKFMNLYPWVDSDHFRMSLVAKKIYQTGELEFYLLATPEENPERKVKWAQAYHDEAGKGIMTTCFAPVYDGRKFVGTVSADLMIDSINSVVEAFGREWRGTMILVDHKENLLAYPSKVASGDNKITKLMDMMPIEESALRAHPDHEFGIVDGHGLLTAPLEHAPFRVYYIEPMDSRIVSFVDRVGVGVFALLATMLTALVCVGVIAGRRLQASSSERPTSF